MVNSQIIDAFIEETKIILNDYLSLNDRLGVLIYEKDYKIICPLINVNKIDNESFSRDLIYYKNSIFNLDNKSEKYFETNDIEFNLGGNNNISEYSQEDSFEMSEKEEKIFDKIKGLVKALNYVINYSITKEIKNDKYIILFTDVLNTRHIEDEQIVDIIENIRNDQNAIFLLVGKNKKNYLKNSKKNLFANEQIIEELILNKFGEKSEIIYFENLKKIKTILSNNKVIKDDVFYPNEIYK